MTIRLACLPPGLSCHPPTLNGPHQDSSFQNEEAVGREPDILYHPRFPIGKYSWIVAQLVRHRHVQIPRQRVSWRPTHQGGNGATRVSWDGEMSMV